MRNRWQVLSLPGRRWAGALCALVCWLQWGLQDLPAQDFHSDSVSDQALTVNETTDFYSDDDPAARELAQFQSLLEGKRDESTDDRMGRDFQDRMPADPAADPYSQYLHAQPNRRWNLTFLTGYEYDTNVPLSPRFSGLGSGIAKDDSRWINALFGDYRIVQQEDWMLGVTGSVFQTSQFTLNQYDVQNYSGGVYSNKAYGDWILSSNYQFSEALLDKEQFSQNHRLSGSVTLLEGDYGHTTAYYEFENVQISGQALIPAQIRSGNINSVGITKAVYLFDGLGRLFAGYRFDDADTKGSDFVRQSHMVTGRIEIPLSVCDESWFSTVVFDAEARFFWDDYEHPNNLDFFERPRSDQRLEVRAGLQKFLSSHLSLRLDYTYIDSDSNVENLFDVSFYSYQRHILSTQLIYDF